MIKSNETLEQAKKRIKDLQEKPLEVTLNLGRNKFVKFMARLDGVYNALFTVKPIDENYKVKTAYSYSEYLCGKVKIKEGKQIKQEKIGG